MSSQSLIRVKMNVYSVPSRLVGDTLRVMMAQALCGQMWIIRNRSRRSLGVVVLPGLLSVPKFQADDSRGGQPPPVQLVALCMDWAKHRRRKAAAKCCDL